MARTSPPGQVMTALALATPVDQAEATFIRRGAQWLNTAPDSKGSPLGVPREVECQAF